VVERSALRDRVVALLDDRTARSVVVLTGPAGTGKTQLALDAAARGGTDLVVVRASLGLAEVAVAALLPLLSELGVDPPGQRVVHAELLGSLRSALDQRHQPLRLVVDDAPRLDRVAAAFLSQLAHHEDLSMVLTARDGEALDESISQLLRDGTATSVPVGPLSAGEVECLLSELFDAAVDPGTVQALLGRSGGNPLYLRELVNGTCAAGAMSVGPHGVVLQRSVPSDRLVDLISQHFDRLEPAQVDVLELLAIAQPLPLEALGVPADALVELERSGLVAVDAADGPSQLRLGHPVHEEVLRATIPPLRRRERQRAAAHILSSGDAASLFRSVSLRVDAGDRVPDGELVGAARRALGLLDHVTAVRLGAAARDAGAEFWGNLIVGAANSSLGDLGSASSALDAAAVSACDDEERAVAAQQRGLHLAIRVGRPTDAVDQAEMALAAISDPRWARFLAADLAKWRLMAGRPVDDLLEGALRARGVDRPVGPHCGVSASEDHAALLNEQVFRALVTVMNGELTAAGDAIGTGLPLALKYPEVSPNAQDLLALSQYLLLTFAGSLAEAEELGRDGLVDAARRRGEPEGMWAYALAVMDLHRGHAGSAAARAALAISRLEWRDFTGLRPVARSLRATALAQLGRLGEARAELDLVDATSLADPKVDLQFSQAHAWLAVSEREIEVAVELLRSAGRRAMASQHRCLGALTSYEAVRLGGAAVVVDDLVDAASRSEGRLLAMLADHATAAASKDSEALDSVSLRLAEMGLTLAAADASAQAARVHRRAGRSEAARRSERRAQGLAVTCDGRRGTESEADVTAVPLTPREREVALLAARRERSREIAASLGISVRTVDNHLASVYRKLGVVGRDEMAVALAELGLLGPAPSSTA